MSFCQEVKKQIASVSESACCRSASLCALLQYGTSQHQSGRVLRTESATLVDYTEKALKPLIPAVRTTKTARGYYYVMTLPDMPLPTIKRNNDCCQTAYLRGAFLSIGRITDPDKGYGLEFIPKSLSLAQELCAFLTELGYTPTLTTRGKQYVCYYRNSEVIEDLLSLMGATDAAFTIMNTKIAKDVRSSINRHGNCDSANADKMIEAAQAQIADIKALVTIGAFNALPPDVKECATLRLQHPEASLTELGGMCETPVSKSAVARRLKKLKDYIR